LGNPSKRLGLIARAVGIAMSVSNGQCKRYFAAAWYWFAWVLVYLLFSSALDNHVSRVIVTLSNRIAGIDATRVHSELIGVYKSGPG
jgi:uncharacterized membrane protein